MRYLIAFFSRKGNNYVSGKIVDLPVGNTEIAAKKIQTLAGGDLYEIRTVHTYSEDYQECTREAKAELQKNVSPQLVQMPLDLEQVRYGAAGLSQLVGNHADGCILFFGELRPHRKNAPALLYP